MKLEEEINKFTHEVEETFRDVKEHVILTVEQHSLLIALGLMSLTTAILIIGTVYVWCFHHPSRADRSRSRSSEQEEKKKSENGPMETNYAKGQVNEEKDKGEATAQNNMAPVSSEKKTEPQTAEPQGIDEVKEGREKEGEVRKRIPSSSGSVNNNESPVKSKIPVRRSTSRTKQS